VRIYLYSLVVLAMRMAMHVARAMRSGTHLVTKREREREREGGSNGFRKYSIYATRTRNMH